MAYKKNKKFKKIVDILRLILYTSYCSDEERIKQTR